MQFYPYTQAIGLKKKKAPLSIFFLILHNLYLLLTIFQSHKQKETA